MFDFLQNLTKSAEEKRQEAVAAYLDEALSARARQRFEQEMAQDESLRLEVAQLRLIKQSLRQLPQREVPRNFILDPAKYGRPARQPWVQAYPVLRVATAMTAFFLIFAFAAGIFANLGTAEPIASAPAADVAQMESVEVTRVVTEATETLAYDTDEEEAMAEDESAEVDTETFAEEAAEEVVVEEEMAAADAAEEAEAPSVPEATAVIATTDSIQEESIENGAPASEPLIVPTPTVSTLPRVTPPTPLPDRDMESAAGGEAADEAVAELPETDDGAEAVVATAVPPEEAEPELVEVIVDGPPNTWLRLQVWLGLLFLLLVALTFYARRQR